MIRLILLMILLLASLLVLFRAPTNLLWYLSILMTEFSLGFFVLVGILLCWRFGDSRYLLVSNSIGFITLAIFALPSIQAFLLAKHLPHDFNTAFGSTASTNNTIFNPLRLLTNSNASKIGYQSFVYDEAHQLTLHFYRSSVGGIKPCVVVIHGGSWAAGDSQQLPELNSELAKEGYQVASINYRLAPSSTFPSTTEDVATAINFLKANAGRLSIDTTRFILLGRSAGGQIALTAAYTSNDASIRGVICFYGPTDMVWGYQNPTNPLVLNSRKIMEDYLGGTLAQKKEQYIASSATETVTDATPPTLMIYGEHDPLVSPRHGTRLSKSLIKHHIPFFELYLPWATHGFDYTLNGPGGQLSTWAVKRFLEEVRTR